VVFSLLGRTRISDREGIPGSAPLLFPPLLPLFLAPSPFSHGETGEGFQQTLSSLFGEKTSLGALLSHFPGSVSTLPDPAAFFFTL